MDGRVAVVLVLENVGTLGRTNPVIKSLCVIAPTMDPIMDFKDWSRGFCAAENGNLNC